METTDTAPVMVTSSGASETWTGALSSDWNTPGNWSGGAVPASGDTVTIPAGTPNNATLSNALLNGEIINLISGPSAAPTISFSDVTLGVGTTLQASNSGIEPVGTVDLTGTFTIASGATLAPAVGSSMALANTGTAATTENAGTIASFAGSSLAIDNGGSISNTATLHNTGLILADGGEIGLDPASSIFPTEFAPETLVNDGTVAMTNGGALELNGSVAGGDVTFDGVGTLTLLFSNAFGSNAAVSGFGQGDQIELGVYAGSQGQLSFASGALIVTKQGTIAQTIKFDGTYDIGNIENEFTGSSVGAATVIAYAPDGGYAGTIPADIRAPAAASVSQGATLSLGNVAVQDIATTASATIDAGSGTLFMNGGTGSGSSHITLDVTSVDQLSADLATLSYAPGASGGSDIVSMTIQSGPISTTREIPIAIAGGGGGPTLNEPSSETVSPNGIVAVSGNYSDSFAQSNPGQLFLSISDSSGTLSATDASGNTVPGSGTNSIALSTDYVDVNAILAGLHYTAGSASGTDQISFEVWNQAGVETTGTTAVTVDPPTGSRMASVVQPGANELASNFSTGITNVATAQPTTPPSAFAHDQATPVVGVMPIGH